MVDGILQLLYNIGINIIHFKKYKLVCRFFCKVVFSNTRVQILSKNIFYKMSYIDIFFENIVWLNKKRLTFTISKN